MITFNPPAAPQVISSSVASMVTPCSFEIWAATAARTAG